MAVSSFTGRFDPYQQKEKPQARQGLDPWKDVDFSALEETDTQAPVQPTAAKIPTPSPNPVATTSAQPQVEETDAERIERLRSAVYDTGEPADPDQGEFSKGVYSGTAQTLGLFGAGKAAVGSLFGDEEMVEEGLGYYMEQMKIAEKYAPNVGTLEEIDLTDEGGFGRSLDYLAYTFGNVLPSIAVSLGTGGAAGIAAGTVAKYTVKESAEAAIEALAKKQIADQATSAKLLKKLKLKDEFDVEANERLQELIREDLEGVVAKDAAKRYKQDVINKQAKKYGLAGAGGVSVALNTGENFAAILEETGVEAPVTAITAGLAAGALDTFAVPLRVAKQLAPDMLDPLRDHLASEVLRNRDKIKRVLVEVGKTSGIEGMTEATQQVITELAVTFVNNNFTEEQTRSYLDAIASEEGRSKILNAAAAGVIGGGGVSTITAAGGEVINEIRQRPIRGETAQILSEERLKSFARLREEVATVVDAEFSESPTTTEALPPPLPVVQEELVEYSGEQSEAVTDLIDVNPQMTLEDVIDESGLDGNLVETILDDLENTGRLVGEVVGGERVYSVADVEPEADVPETQERIEPTIDDSPGQEVVADPAEPVIGAEADAEPEAVVDQESVEPKPSLLERAKRAVGIKPPDPNAPIVEFADEGVSGNQRKVTFPETGNEYFIYQFAKDAGGGWAAAKAADGLEINEELTPDYGTEQDAVDYLTELENRKKAALDDRAEEVVEEQTVTEETQPELTDVPAPEPEPVMRVAQPTAMPKTTRDPEFDMNGEYILTFPDGDVRRIYKDDDTKVWYDVEGNGKGDFTDMFGIQLDYENAKTKKEAILGVVEKRQREFDQFLENMPDEDAAPAKSDTVVEGEPPAEKVVLPSVGKPSVRRIMREDTQDRSTTDSDGDLFNIRFPDSGNIYVVDTMLDPAEVEGKGGLSWHIAQGEDEGKTLGYTREQMIETLTEMEQKLAADGPKAFEIPANKISPPYGGGMWGMDGIWYPANSTIPESAAEPKNKYVVTKTAGKGKSRKQQISPSEYAVPPKGQESIFKAIQDEIDYDINEAGQAIYIQLKERPATGTVLTAEDMFTSKRTSSLMEAYKKGIRFYDPTTYESPASGPVDEMAVTAVPTQGTLQRDMPFPELEGRVSPETMAKDERVMDVGSKVGSVRYNPERQGIVETVESRIESINRDAGQVRQMMDGDTEFVLQPVDVQDLFSMTLGSETKPIILDLPTRTLWEEAFAGTRKRGTAPRIEDIGSTAYINQYVDSYLDLLERGMPGYFLRPTGVYSTSRAARMTAGYQPSTNSVVVNPLFIEASMKGGKLNRNSFLFTLAHEHWHLADNLNTYSDWSSMGFRELHIDDASFEMSDNGLYELDFGDAVQQVYDAYEAGTDLGQIFNYPFSSMGDQINNAYFNTDSRYTEDQIRDGFDRTFRVGEVINTIRKEVFAQSGALFITKPNELKKEAPLMYDIFKQIVSNPELSGEELISGQSDRRYQQVGITGDRTVLPDIRTSPQPRGDEVRAPRGGQPQSERGGRDGTARGRMGEQEERQDGDDPRQPLGQLDLDLIPKQQEYLYQRSKGNVRGKFAITKEINPQNAEAQLPELNNLVNRHPDSLSSPAKWLAFERDLLGDNLTLRPPHGLIALYNDMDLWAETHGQLSDEQLKASKIGLNIAKEMGDLYASGDVDPAITGKLMLWGLMSRMLTASAQEAGFVDLLSKHGGGNTTAIESFIDQSLMGDFTDKDISRWRTFVPKAIPESSFGRSGTSNANDFGNFLKKMAEPHPSGVSKLEALHNLISDRSIPTHEVRRQFMSMAKNPGIGTKVFSFLMLMTGRDDVVILDRIQLNTMWDTGRYGKLIYDDIAPNFEGNHGLARYEVMENALATKIDELYTRLGRPEDASVGRYHWESWVLNSGQVVSHPTMRGLVKDIKREAKPYAYLGAPEGRQNKWRYGSIYALDENNRRYFLYPNSEGVPYKFTPPKFNQFIDQIKLKKHGIIPDGFLVSDYNEGYPWYEADGVNRQNLDKLIEAYAQRKATPLEYGIEEDIASQVASDGSRQGLESGEVLLGPAFREVTDVSATRNRLVQEIERAGLGGEGIPLEEITNKDLIAMSPEGRNLINALKRDDFLGFDNIDDLMVTIFDEGIDNYEVSQGTKRALGRYVNMNYGATGDVDFMTAPKNTVDFNAQDEKDLNRDLQYRLEKSLPFYKGLMDQYVGVKQLERKIAAARGVDRLPAAESFYDAENLMHGKSSEELDKVQKRYLEPLQEVLKKGGVGTEALGKYLLAKHAPERNLVIAAKALAKREKLVEQATADENQSRLQWFDENPIPFQNYETEQGGSGISNLEAAAILGAAESEGLTPVMEEASQIVYDMLKEHRDRMVENQLLDEETRGSWESNYEFYVPLKGFAAVEGIDADYKPSDGARGFSIVGSESLKAKGRTTLPANPLINSILDVAAKIKRGEKNKASIVLLDTLENSGFTQGTTPWTIYNNKFRPQSRADGPDMMTMDEMDRARRANGDPRFVRVKKGGQTFWIEFHEDEMNRVVQSLGEQPLNVANSALQVSVNGMRVFQNFRRNMLINYNPAWGLVNPVRDVMTAIPYAMSESFAKGSRTQGKDVTAKMVINYPSSMRAYWRHVRGKTGRSDKAREYDRYVNEYFEDGSPTGMVLDRTYEEQIRVIENELKSGFTRNSLKAVAEFVEDYNQTMENAVRVSAYVEARKAGAPRLDAATFAKDLTVNFNRKGEKNAFWNLGYLFFNAAQQGTQNFIQAVGRGGYKIPAFISSLVAAGYTTTVYNILNSELDDDDEPVYDDYTESQLKRTIGIMKEDGSMISMPIPYGFAIFFNGGRLLAEMQYGVKTEAETALALTQNVIDNFSPVDLAEGDNIYEEARGLAPDVAELWLDLAINKNYFGSPIKKEPIPFAPGKADAWTTKPSTSESFKIATQWLNEKTGKDGQGSAYRPGAIDISPDQIEYIFSWWFGGVGRFVGDVSDVVVKAGTDPEELRLVDTPIINGWFYKEPSEYKDRMEFYENSRKYQSILQEAKEAEEGDEERLRELGLGPYYDPQLQLVYRMSNKSLRELRTAETDAEKTIEDPWRLRETLKKIEASEEKIFDNFNKRFRAAQKAAGQ